MSAGPNPPAAAEPPWFTRAGEACLRALAVVVLAAVPTALRTAGAGGSFLGGWLLGVRDTQLLGLAVLAVITVAISIVGDLLESLMKRHAQVKDSGTIFPGHGGLMDRLDSVFAALPVFVTGLLLLGL